MNTEYSFVRFHSNGKLWVLEPDKTKTELEIDASLPYHAKVLPHPSDGYCHLLFSDEGVLLDVKKEWFEIIG